jgi:hypothetical protein
MESRFSNREERLFWCIFASRDVLSFILKFQSPKYRKFTDWKSERDVIKCGHLYILQHHLNLARSFNQIDLAAQYGHLDVIKYLHSTKKKYMSSTNAVDWAARSGHLHVIKWLHSNRSSECTVYSIRHAAENGYSEVVKWLYENKKECRGINDVRNIIQIARVLGHLDISNWLEEKLSYRMLNKSLYPF